MKNVLNDQQLEHAIVQWLNQAPVRTKLLEYSEVNLARSHLKRHFGLLYGVSFERVAKILDQIPLQEMIGQPANMGSRK